MTATSLRARIGGVPGVGLKGVQGVLAAMTASINRIAVPLGAG